MTPPHPGLDTAARPTDWSVQDSRALYRLGLWGRGMFAINPQGHLAVVPQRTAGPGIDLKQLVDELAQRDVHTPVLIRFSDLLQQRLDEIAQAFDHAIKDHEYQAGYQAVYPIKVNQQRHVVESMLASGARHGFGLEAGSKPELLAVMAMVDCPETPIVCNGFKDRAFIEAVILATKLGKNIIPVVEKFTELKLLIEYAKKHDVRPQIGVRVKLASRGTGRWEHSAGARSKFGLFISEALDLVEQLRAEGMLDCLTLLHCHVGSQVNDIRRVKAVVTELARVYCELYRLGAGLTHVDIGGGLGVDYNGSNTAQEGSVNYTLQEYANDIIYHLQTVCDATQTPHPGVISESGRAMAAHHSLLIFDVLGWTGFDRFDLPEVFGEPALGAMPEPVRTLAESYTALNEHNYSECYHDALLARDQTLSLFNLGYCSIEHRGLAERLFFSIGSRVLRYVRRLDQTPESLRTSNRSSRTSTSATARSSSPCPTTGPSTTTSRSCRSTGWTRSRPAGASSRTSPATRTGRSTSSSVKTARKQRSRCTPTPGPRTTSGCFWSGPTRKHSATCTTCSATPTRSTSGSARAARPRSKRSSRAIPSARCCRTCSTSPTTCAATSPARSSRPCARNA